MPEFPIRLLREWNGLRCGHVFTPQPNVAKTLIQRGFAERVIDEDDEPQQATIEPQARAVCKRGRPRKTARGV